MKDLNLPVIEMEAPDDFPDKQMALRHFLHRERIMETCRETVNTAGYFARYPILEVVWMILDHFFSEYDSLLTEEILRAELKKLFAESSPEEDGYTEQDMNDLITDMYRPQPFAESIILSRISEAKKEYHLQNIRAGRGKVDDQIEEVRKAGDLSKVSARPVRVNIWEGLTDIAQLNQHLKTADRYPTGVDFVDRALGGGVMPGEVIGFVMPTKAGKTTLGLQMACEAVLRGHYVLYIQFEQLITGDLAKRQIVLASGGTRKDWYGSDATKARPDLQDKVLKAAEIWAEYLYCYDTWVGSQNPLNDPSEVYDLVQEIEEDSGRKVGLVILDWWGLMRNKLLSANNINDEKMTRRKQQEWMHSIKHYSGHYAVPTILFHQVAGAAAARKSGTPTAHDAQGDKDWPNLMDACFVSSRKDTDSVVNFSLDTSRSTANMYNIRVKLDGEGCRFISDNIDVSSELMEAVEDAEDIDEQFE